MGKQASNQNQAPPVRLTWQTLEGESQERVLDKGKVIIGRMPEGCDICIADYYASRHHAEISFDGKNYLVRDLGSANGTFLNDQRLEAPQVLQDGDLVKVGRVVFYFERPASPAPSEFDTLELAAPAVIPYLEICSGGGKQSRFELINNKVTIGRAGGGKQWDLTLQDRAVSRPQAQIACQDDGYLLTDLGSANGTLVNGTEISAPHLLKDGDAIVFGETVLVFHAGKAAP
jgi:pSer/pThr/pTyr-binding forkhead associated (FHA) protein